MTTVDDLFARFRAAYRSGEAADPRSYLDRLTGTDRSELEALILAFLEADPGDPYSPEAFAAFRATPEHARLQEAIHAEGETWPALLPRLRDAAELPRRTLVARLAAALGVSAQEEKVGDYYHRMESGRLDPSGVSDRVLEALGRIVGASAERLRTAGRALQERPGAGGAVFARTGQPADLALDAVSAAPAADAEAAGPRDEVDELFTGGRRAPSA